MKRFCSILLYFLIIASMVISVCAVSSVPEPVMEATESVIRVLAEYTDGYATGSGFVIKSDKDETLVATNYHVVDEKPYSISVWLNEEETVNATILAYTDQKDMCILKLADPVELKALAFAEDGAKQGEGVYAVGFPGAADTLSDKEAHAGTDATITDGIVSAVRESTVSSYGIPTKILQINAAINPGNSGGPLFNVKGEVVGINTYKNNDSQGIFGAIDVSELKSFMADHAISVPNTESDFPWIIFAVVAGIAVGGIVVLIIVMRRRKMKAPVKEETKKTSLREYMAAYPNGIGMNDAVAMLLPVALQLKDLHDHDGTHLQVSPNSISVGANGAILADATAAEADRYTSGYAAPEIYKGTSTGNQSDIYSFCAVLSYVASGKQPANALSRADAEIEDSESTQFDSVFSEVINTGMALDSANRFSSMQEVIIKLSPYNVQPFVKAVSDVEESAPAEAPVRKGKVSAVIMAVGAVAVVVVALIGTYVGCYLGAKANAKNGDFDTANSLLIVPQITKLHDAELVEYVAAGQLMADRNYAEAKTAFEDLPGYLNADELAQEAHYRQALQYADKNEFRKAVRILTQLSDQNYAEAKEKVKDVQHRWAWSLIEEEKYVDAYKKLDSIRGYSDVNDTISTLTEAMYLKGQALYYEEEFTMAKELFECIPSHADSTKYITLINAQSDESWYEDAANTVDKLMKIFYFEDAAEVLLSKTLYAIEFLQGRWEDAGYYFEIDEEYNSENNFNFINFDAQGFMYFIWNGNYVFVSEDDPNVTYKQLHITAITPNKIEIYSYDSCMTYTLTRQ